MYTFVSWYLFRKAFGYLHQKIIPSFMRVDTKGRVTCSWDNGKFISSTSPSVFIDGVSLYTIRWTSGVCERRKKERLKRMKQRRDKERKKATVAKETNEKKKEEKNKRKKERV